jgi:hypothetical protein
MQCVQDGLLGVVSVGSCILYQVAIIASMDHGRRTGLRASITVFGHTTIAIISMSDWLLMRPASAASLTFVFRRRHTSHDRGFWFWFCCSCAASS